MIRDIVDKIQHKQAIDIYNKIKDHYCANSDAVEILEHKHLEAIVASEYFNDELTDLIKNVNDIFDNSDLPNVEIIKDGDSTTLAKTKCGDIDIIVKRYNLNKTKKYISRQFGITRAMNSWLKAHLLDSLGFNSPTPIAIIQKKKIGLINLECFFIYKMAPGDVASNFFNEKHSSESKFELASKLAGLIKKLHKFGITHGDMKFQNFLISRRGIEIIDLDSMTLHGNISLTHNHAIKKDRNRFLEDIQNSCDCFKIIKSLLQ